MKLLEDRILKDGHIGADNVLKVDSFLNHQIDVSFVCELGKEFYRLFKDENITKILTIEASGMRLSILVFRLFLQKRQRQSIFIPIHTTQPSTHTLIKGTMT